MPGTADSELDPIAALDRLAAVEMDDLRAAVASAPRLPGVYDVT